MSDTVRLQDDPDRPLIERWKRATLELDEVSQEIFERYAQRVAGLLRRKGHSPDEVQELTQKTFLGVFKGLRGFRGDTRLAVWILLIAQNAHYSGIRAKRARKREHQEVPLDDPGEELIQVSADVASPEEEFSKKEQTAAVRLAMTELPPRRRRCIERYSQGCSIREIAGELGISRGTVQAHLHQARQQLRKMLDRHYSDPGFDLEKGHERKGTDAH